MSPAGRTFRQRCRMNPSLISCCTIDWYDEWSEEAMLVVASIYLPRSSFTLEVTKSPDVSAMSCHVTYLARWPLAWSCDLSVVATGVVMWHVPRKGSIHNCYSSPVDGPIYAYKNYSDIRRLNMPIEGMACCHLGKDLRQGCNSNCNSSNQKV